MIVTAFHFLRENFPFLDQRWIQNFVQPKLAALIETKVKEHTSEVRNTALIEACREIVSLTDHALIHMPSGGRKCYCSDLNDGEHKPQPVCARCAIAKAKKCAADALGQSHG